MHRDLKLENLLLDEDFKLKVCDFGFAAKYIDNQGKRIKMDEFKYCNNISGMLELYKQQHPNCSYHNPILELRLTYSRWE